MRISDWSSDVCSSDLIPCDLEGTSSVRSLSEGPAIQSDWLDRQGLDRAMCGRHPLGGKPAIKSRPRNASRSILTKVDLMHTSVSKLPNGVRCKPLAIGRRRETTFTSQQSVKGIGGSEPASLRNTIARPGHRFPKPAGIVADKVHTLPCRV